MHAFLFLEISISCIRYNLIDGLAFLESSTLEIISAFVE
jgi:hypothetical protein